MLHIILMILKIIGLILLGILGLLLGILLFVLFSAIRYRIDGEKQEALKGQVTVRWLLGIVSVQAVYEQGLRVTMKLFWHTLFTSEDEEKAAEPKETNRKETDIEEADAEEADSEAEAEAEKKAEESPEEETELPSAEPLGEGQQAVAEQAEQVEEPADHAKEPQKKAAKRFSFDKICAKLKQIVERILRIPERLDKIRLKLSSIGSQLAVWADFINDPLNQKSFRLILRQIKRILAYLLSGKGNATVTFGLDDPYLMGQILQAAAFFYPVYQDHVILHPRFDEQVLTGELHYRGHVRLGSLVWMVLRLLFDRNIRRKLMAALKGDSGTHSGTGSGRKQKRKRRNIN